MKKIQKNIKFVKKMDYNTSREKLKQPEYGRIVQQMVDYCLTVEDRNERNKIAKTIIYTMESTIPNYKGTPEMRRKLCHHLAIMADFKLDIDWEYSFTEEENIKHNDSKIKYKREEILYRHFGKFAQKMVEKIPSKENEEEKNQLIEIIGNNMKRLSKSQKNEIISDDVIFDSMQQMSKEAITIPENLKLSDWKEPSNNKAATQNSNKKKKKKNNNF